MDIDLTKALRESVQRVISDHCTGPQLHKLIDGEADRRETQLWRTAGKLGWMSVAVPEEHGGLGAGLAELSAIQKELGRCLAPIPFLTSALVARAVALWPHQGLPDKWLPGLMSGALVGAMGGFSPEPGGLRAVRESDGFRFEGECPTVLEGDIADVILVLVETEEGLGVALVERGQGIETEALTIGDPTRGLAMMRCSGAQVPSAQIAFAPRSDGLVGEMADAARLLVASDCIGGSEAALAATIEYLKTRVQFGKPIGTFQALKHRCADHKLRLETSRRCVASAIDAAAQGASPYWSRLAKVSACDAYWSIAADCVQLHGGIGFTWEHDAHLYLKRAVLNEYLHGQGFLHLDRIATILTEGARQ